jgi:antitoxin CcdA
VRAGCAEEPAVAQRRKWREENREAIQAYNERIEKRGAFSDGVRRF